MNAGQNLRSSSGKMIAIFTAAPRSILKHGAGASLDFAHLGARQLLGDMRQKLGLVTFLCRLPCGVPAFIVKPANEHRQLRPKMRSIFRADTVAHRMQHGTQRGIGAVPS